MNKKLYRVLCFLIVAGGLLTGCGATEESSGSEAPIQVPKPAYQKAKDVPEPKKDESGITILKEVGQTADSEAGTGELMKIKNVNEMVDIAPLEVTVKDIKVIKLSDVSETFAQDLSLLSNTTVQQLKDGFSYIQVQYTAENTKDQNIEWYDLMNVVTDKGEQIDAQMKDFMNDDADTDSQFIGKVKKDFQDCFVIENGDINSVKLVFGNTVDSATYDEITGEQTVEYRFE